MLKPGMVAWKRPSSMAALILPALFGEGEMVTLITAYPPENRKGNPQMCIMEFKDGSRSEAMYMTITGERQLVPIIERMD
jgi:hypothetical protein